MTDGIIKKASDWIGLDWMDSIKQEKKRVGIEVIGPRETRGGGKTIKRK
jgi:hypothetical protein